MQLKIFQVAAFTERLFGGNPAAVIPLESWLPDELLQNIAAENNLSETAFLVPAEDYDWHIRWFTPTVEVPLCGHATLASAAVIDNKLQHPAWPISLRSASGLLTVSKVNNGYELDFPALQAAPAEPPAGLADALGTDFLECYLARDIFMLILPDERAVAALSPDFAALAGLTEHGVIVTAVGDRDDFVSRFFAPSIGIDEDPVTGAAHCVMVPYWARRLGKSQLLARQISSRVGVLVCEDRGERGGLQGKARFFLDGTISVPD